MTRPHKSAGPGAAPRTRAVEASDQRAPPSPEPICIIGFFSSFFLPETCLKTQVKAAKTCTLKSGYQVSAQPWPRAQSWRSRRGEPRAARRPRPRAARWREGGSRRLLGSRLAACATSFFFFFWSADFSGQVRHLGHARTCRELRTGSLGRRGVGHLGSGAGSESLPPRRAELRASERGGLLVAPRDGRS